MANPEIKIDRNQFVAFHNTMIELTKAVRRINETLETYFSSENADVDAALQEGEESDGAS